MLRWWTEGGSRERVVEAILRVGVAGCFIGHGAFGIIGKEGWLPYFAVAGIPESWAWILMPVVGTIDILVGILAFVSPRPAILAYAAGWAVWTAALRPLAGESVFETLERAGNYGIPIAFLVAAGFAPLRARLRDWWAPVRVLPLTRERTEALSLALRATLALLLIGHGGLAVGGKTLLAQHLASVGLPPVALPVLGWAEIALGLAVMVRPIPALLVGAFALKVSTEALYPMTGAPSWEFVERMGSYMAPLALLALSPTAAGRLAPAGAVARRGALTLLATLALLASTTATAAAPAGVAGASPPTPDAPQERDVLGHLRAGTVVLACRHAVTDRSRGDSRRVDYDDPGTQRVLSGEGRAQARRLGEVLRRLGVPVGDVLASPYARTRDSAELGFGRVELSDALVYGDRPEQRRERRRLLTRPTDGGVRILMTHQGILYGAVSEAERGSIREGDCLALLPGGDGGYRFLGRFGPDELEALVGLDRASRDPAHFSNISAYRPAAAVPHHS